LPPVSVSCRSPASADRLSLGHGPGASRPMPEEHAGGPSDRAPIRNSRRRGEPLQSRLPPHVLHLPRNVRPPAPWPDRCFRLPPCPPIVAIRQRSGGGQETNAYPFVPPQCMTEPPSTTTVWPVMKALSGEQRKTSGPIMSSGSASRRS